MIFLLVNRYDTSKEGDKYNFMSLRGTKYTIEQFSKFTVADMKSGKTELKYNFNINSTVCADELSLLNCLDKIKSLPIDIEPLKDMCDSKTNREILHTTMDKLNEWQDDAYWTINGGITLKYA